MNPLNDKLQREIDALMMRDRKRVIERSKTRDTLRSKDKPEEQVAVMMAEMGYGIGAIVERTGVEYMLARRIVTGE